MSQQLPRRMSKGQLELLYLIGKNVEPYEIYIRSGMTIERQRLVLSRLIKRFQFRSIDDVKSYYHGHKPDIHLRLEQLGSYAIDPCGGPVGRNDHPKPTEHELWHAAVILQKLADAGAKNP